MAFSDLSTISEILKQLIVHGLDETGALGSAFEVVTLPPDEVTASVDTLNIHLIHIGPEMSQRAFSDTTPERQDLALRLRFQLTVHNRLADSRDNLRIQKLLGLAMRVLHSYPRLDRETVVNGTNLWSAATVLDPIAALDVTLIPVEFEQSLSHWNAMESAHRTAVYYEVGNVYLEPLQRPSPGEPVLEPSATAGVGGTPFVMATQSSILFETEDGGARPYTLRPARATYGAAVEVIGAHLSNATKIELRDDDLTHVLTDSITKTTATKLTFMLPPSSASGVVSPGLTRIRVGSDRSWSNTEAIWVTPAFSLQQTGPRTFALQTPVDPSWDVAVSVHGVDLVQVVGPVTASTFQTFPNRIEFEVPQSVEPGRTLARLTVNDASTGPIWLEVQ